MNNLKRQYEATKNKANAFMKDGQITQYFEALLEMNKCKKLMIPIVVK